MNPEDAVDFGREAVMVCLTLAAPILVVGVIAATVIGVVQAMTQVQDQAVSFIPKIVLIAITFVLFLPWMTDRFVEYGREMLETPRFMTAGSPVRVDITDGRSEGTKPSDMR